MIESVMGWFRGHEVYGMLGPRAEGFAFALEHLMGLNRELTIVETGSLRSADEPHAWLGDGRSTALFKLWLDHVPFMDRVTVASIDLNPEATANVAALNDPRIVGVTADSIQWLGGDVGQFAAEHCGLLYLDSFDWTPQLNQQSAFHHLAELALVYARLPRGSLIMVDDCHAHMQGKHWLVAAFFERLDVIPAYQGYQTGWVKP